MASYFTQFKGHKYLNLETYRKTGEAVKTPVWFVQEENTLYVRTLDGSGKVKRIRNNRSIRVAPCSVNGNVLGEWETAVATMVEGAEADRVDKMLGKKYGLMKKLFEIGSKKQAVNIVLKIEAIS